MTLEQMAAHLQMKLKGKGEGLDDVKNMARFVLQLLTNPEFEFSQQMIVQFEEQMLEKKEVVVKS